MNKLLKQIEPTAASRISTLLIHREHESRLSKMWEANYWAAETTEEKTKWFLMECECDLECLLAEKELFEDFGIALRDHWSGQSLDEEIAMNRKWIKDSKISCAA